VLLEIKLFELTPGLPGFMDIPYQGRRCRKHICDRTAIDTAYVYLGIQKKNNKFPEEIIVNDFFVYLALTKQINTCSNTQVPIKKFIKNELKNCRIMYRPEKDFIKNCFESKYNRTPRKPVLRNMRMEIEVSARYS
jgi:hypothetical protein